MNIKKYKLFKFFSSLKLAVISILTLAAVLAWATILESFYGMRAAHLMVYGTWWFAGVLGLLALNVFCAAMSRYPWKRSQIGFVVTHAGILTIMLGSVLTQRWGVDGTLPVEESKENNEVMLTNLVLAFYNEGGNLQAEIPIPEAGRAAKGNLVDVTLGEYGHIVVDQFLPRVVSDRQISPSPLAGVGAPALKVDLNSSRFNVSEWLVASASPSKPAELNLGPATLSLRKLWLPEQDQAFLKAKPEEKTAAKKSSAGYILVGDEGREFRIRIEDSLAKWMPFGGHYQLRIERYLPYAVVEKNQLISKSNEPVNPAVQLLIKDEKGFEEKHTLFANFPEFNTLHRNRDSVNHAFGLKLKMVGGSGPAPLENLPIVGKGRGRLEFAVASDGQDLLWRSFGMSGDLKGKGKVTNNQPMSTGWMDSTFTIPNWYPAAVQQEVPRYVDEVAGMGEANFLSSIHIKQVAEREKASDEGGKWLIEGNAESIPMGTESWIVQLAKEKLRLPFQIHLDKFKVGTDPGTQTAATYESQVVVQDPVTKSTKAALISMNEPLVYGGYTFYQASYQAEEGRPPISVFAVNYDPGRMVKYAGTLFMVLGIILMFYMNPHYWDKVLGRKRVV